MPSRFETDKFEETIRFTFVSDLDDWYPIVNVTFLSPNQDLLQLPLLFDTGADQICLHPYWETFFPQHLLLKTTFDGLGVRTDQEQDQQEGKHTSGRIEFLGRIIDCDIGFTQMPDRIWMAGVFGRECFKPFGFGFWEEARKLYVTLRP